MADLIETVRRLSSLEIRELLAKREAEDKALVVLLRAATAKERMEERRRRDREGNTCAAH